MSGRTGEKKILLRELLVPFRFQQMQQIYIILLICKAIYDFGLINRKYFQKIL